MTFHHNTPNSHVPGFNLVYVLPPASHSESEKYACKIRNAFAGRFGY